MPKQELIRIIKKNFDLRPGAIVKFVTSRCSRPLGITLYRALDLKKPVFQSTASYGHFGRPGYTWETAKVRLISSIVLK